MDRVAAVHDQAMPGDVARLLGREEGDRRGDLVGPAGPPQGRVLAADRLSRQLGTGRDPAGEDGR
jgi:hypothetical protein